jgi:hypothetical protein
LPSAPKNIHPVQKILVIDLVAVGQILERHFHQREHVLALHVGFLDEDGLGARSMSSVTLVTGRKLPRSTRMHFL